jgi:hypothetical protein
MEIPPHYKGTRLERTEKQSFKDSLLDALAMIKAALTTFWFWVPVLFAVFLYVELYLMIINPLLFLVGPIIIILYALHWEEKRAKAQYGATDIRVMRSSNPIFATPRKISAQEEVDELVEEYQKLLRKRHEKSTSAETKEKHD